MEIKQIKAFVAIAETKTFTAAARRVEVTQAAVSMQIRQLEEGLGVPLFTRTPRRVILTEAGERLLKRARNILREHDAALEEIAELAGAEFGRLRIGSASAVFATEQLPAILKQLIEDYPNAEISVVSGTSQALIDKIQHGDIDVAFVSLPVEDANIITELLYSDEIVAIAHPSHPLASKTHVSTDTLMNQPLILGEKGGNTRRMIDDFFKNSETEPNIVMELSRQEAVNRMVESKMGVGISGAKYAAEDVKNGKLVAWQIDGAKIRWELGLACLKSGYFSPIAKHFTILCKESFEDK
jgi:DNA-binding transcriptional LysR family regulator